MSSWRECKLGEIIEIIGGGTPKTSISEYWNGNIPWLSVVDFNTGKKYVSKTEKTITEEGLKNSSTKLLQKNDIIISARGTVGVLAMLDKPMTFNQSCYGIRAKENESTNDYIFYLLKDTVNQLLQISHGGVFDTITKATFDEIDISLPPLEEQKTIAEVFSSLDDKIDLLHRQNQTLESLAQTLFRQWFIEEAKEEWEVGTFGDLVEVSSGKSLKRELFDDMGKYEVLGANGKIGKTNEWLFEEELIYTGRVGTLGNIFLIDEAKKVWLSDNTLVVKPKKYFYFIYFLMIDFQLENLNVGSTQPLVRQSDLKNIEISLPNDEIVLRFEQQSKGIFKKINQNKKQIQTLENLRDTLLPKLLSGEVRVEI